MTTPYQTEEYRKWDRERSKERNEKFKTLAIKLPKEMQRAFKWKCRESGLNMNGVVKLLIISWINESISIGVSVNNKNGQAKIRPKTLQ